MADISYKGLYTFFLCFLCSNFFVIVVFSSIFLILKFLTLNKITPPISSSQEILSITKFNISGIPIPRN